MTTLTLKRIERFRTDLHAYIPEWCSYTHTIFDTICDLALDGLRLRQGRMVMDNNTNCVQIAQAHLQPGQSIVLINKEAK